MEDIAVGAEHTLALTSTGDVWAWGMNTDGQCGLGHTSVVREPQRVAELSGKNIKQVSESIRSMKGLVVVFIYLIFFLHHA